MAGAHPISDIPKITEAQAIGQARLLSDAIERSSRPVSWHNQRYRNPLRRSTGTTTRSTNWRRGARKPASRLGGAGIHEGSIKDDGPNLA